jgi:hypothetical protein
MTVDLGRVGIWSRELRYHPDPGARAAAAAELEELGYGAIFIPDAGGDVLGAVGHLLAATRRMPFATGVLNIWMHDPAEVAARRASLVARFGPRLLLGLGNSHAPLVEGVLGVPYARPYAKMTEYLDALDEAEPPVAAGERMLAALGPRMLSLARDRAGAAHPYLVPPEHTAAARQVLGPGITLARSRPCCSAPTGSSVASRPGPSSTTTSPCPTTCAISAALDSPTTIWRAAPATGSWTRWSRTVTRTRSRPGSARTTTRELITCASMSSAAVTKRSRSTPGGVWQPC